jgi:GNAT superfamily N-acetyltransferase
MTYTVRKAKLEERKQLSELIAESARGLSREHYNNAQIEAAIANLFGVDTTLIEDGTYFVAEDEGGLAGCGGWSRRKTLFGGDQYARDVSYSDPETEPAKIRAFFVHPAHARKGVAHAILKECEREAAAHGFRALELMSTLPGVEFYKACGYSEQGTYDLELAEAVTVPFVPMRKDLTTNANGY